MKTQIITLESHDDLISVRDKLSWVKTPRVLLVWPKYEEVSLRLLDLKVLQRHADSLGAHLGLVTRISSVRRDAEALGIPVFESTAAAQKDPWPDPTPRRVRTPKPPRRDLRRMADSLIREEPVWRSSLPGRVIMFALGVLAFLAVAGLFVPRATVTVYPEAQTQSIIIPVAAGEGNSETLLTGEVPAGRISVNVSSTQTMNISGRIPVPKTKARGVVRFSNQSQAEVRIEAGTILETSAQPPIQFITLNETLLAPGADEFVDVPAEAVLPGSSGNAEADSITVVTGPLSLSLTVTNPQAFKGGADEMLTGASAADRDALRAALLDAMRKEAEGKLRAQLAGDDVLILDSLTENILEENSSPEPGQPGGQLNLSMQIQFSVAYVRGADLKQLADRALQSSTPTGFVSARDDGYVVLTEPSVDAAGAAHFEIQATRTLLRQSDFFTIYALVRGRDVQSALGALAGISTRQPAQIALSPAWWPRLPLIPLNVRVNVQ